MTPFRANPEYPRWESVAALIHTEFAYMEPLLGHPAKASKVTASVLAKAANDGAALLVETDGKPIACLFARPSRDFPRALYVGWLAVDSAQRTQGLARALFECAEALAKEAHFDKLTLDTGRVLSDLHALFRKLGFQEIPGDGTIISFTKKVD